MKVMPFDESATLTGDGKHYTQKQEENRRFKKAATISSFVILGLLTLTATALVIIGAVAPCQFKTCHANATCINQPFNAKCKCKYGFNGNGRDHCDECGLAYPTQQTHLDEQAYYYLDGELALPFSFPDAVYIKFLYYTVFDYNKTTYFGYQVTWCFGSIINRRFIMTTGDCVPPIVEFEPYAEDRIVQQPVIFNALHPTWTTILHIYIKLYDYITTNYEITPSDMVSVEDVIYHEGYDLHKLDHDIVLIKLKNPIEFDSKVQPVCIPEDYDLPMKDYYLKYGNPGITLGWTYFYNSSGYWAQLMADYQVNMFYRSNCSDQFPGIANEEEIICAGEYVYLNSPDIFTWWCNGFPGSALYMNKTVGGVTKRMAVGLAANDTVCGYATFTNLFYYSDWIHKNSDY